MWIEKTNVLLAFKKLQVAIDWLVSFQFSQTLVWINGLEETYRVQYRAESENFHYFSAISKNLRPFLSNLHIWQISDLLAVKMLVISQPIRLRWLTTVFPRLSSARYDSLPHVNICRACKNYAKKLPGNQPPTKGPRWSSNQPRFYLTSKVCPNSFAAAYNNKAYALFSSRKLR